MSGNAMARRVLNVARGEGETPEDVYAAVADTFDGLTPRHRAWCLGYLARLIDRSAEANPHDPDGEKSAELHQRWADGWAEGRRGDFEELARRVRRFRGEQADK